MGIEKLRILGNDFIGAWVTATDKFFLFGNEVSKSEENVIRESLECEPIRVTAGSAGFIGIFVAANSNGILMPSGTEQHELSELRKSLPGARVEILQTEHNALKNNILANDKIAILNPAFDRNDEQMIADVLGVETIKMRIGGFSTVGATNILTNKGLVLNNRASEHEKERIEKLTGLQSEQSTANLGSLGIGLSVIANSKGLVAGNATTGFETARIANALGL